jgi:hypothetical protein
MAASMPCLVPGVQLSDAGIFVRHVALPVFECCYWRMLLLVSIVRVLPERAPLVGRCALSAFATLMATVAI